MPDLLRPDTRISSIVSLCSILAVLNSLTNLLVSRHVAVKAATSHETGSAELSIPFALAQRSTSSEKAMIGLRLLLDTRRTGRPRCSHLCAIRTVRVTPPQVASDLSEFAVEIP